jgi:hypothetical protein
MSFKFASLIGVLLLLGHGPVSAQGAEFAWKNYIGQNPSKLINDLKGIADCEPSVQFGYRLKPESDRVTQANFSDWETPSGGGMVLDEEFPSETIQTLTCKISDSVNVKVMQFQERIVSLTVGYQRCDLRGLGCAINRSEADDSAYNLFENLLVVVPELGTGEISNDEYDKFQMYETNIKTVWPLSPSSLNYSGCFYPTLNKTKWRCLVGLRQFDAVLQHFSFAEIDNGTFLNEQKDHILMSQEFVSPELEQQMQTAFIQEVNQKIDQMKAQGETEKAKQDNSKKVIQTLQ